MTHHVHEMQFAELKVTGAFYAVETLSVSLVGAQGDEVSVEAPAGEWNRGNGLVVDSGTTDMYLPVWKSKFYGAFALNRRVDLHAVDATPARWRAPDALVDFHTAADGQGPEELPLAHAKKERRFL